MSIDLVVTPALAQLKTILSTLDPSPAPAPNAVYIFPNEFHIDTTIALAIAAGSDVEVTPAAMDGIFVGSTLAVRDDSGSEIVTVTAVSSSTFTADFSNSYAAGSIVGHSLDLDTVPFITIEWRVNQEGAWGVRTAGRGRFYWEFDIRAVVGKGLHNKDEHFAAVAPLQERYLVALADALALNGTLGGTVEILGPLQNKPDLARYQIGHMYVGSSTTSYWGVGLRVLAQKDYAQQMRA